MTLTFGIHVLTTWGGVAQSPKKAAVSEHCAVSARKARCGTKEGVRDRLESPTNVGLVLLAPVIMQRLRCCNYLGRTSTSTRR